MFRMQVTSTGRLVRTLLAAFAAIAPMDRVLADAKPAAQAEWKLGGTGGWDYLTLDSSGTRLFISRATRVDVVDTRTGKIIGSIDNTDGVHGIALADDLGRGYTSNGKADSRGFRSCARADR